MSGDIQTGRDAWWMTRSSIFYWVVDQLAEQAHDPRLAEHLREISANDLGLLIIDGMEPAQLQELRRLVAHLPELGRRRLPDSEGKAGVLEQLGRLAADMRAGEIGAPAAGDVRRDRAAQHRNEQAGAEPLDDHDVVELTQDLSTALRAGMRGTVVMVYAETGDDYEVEFVQPDGTLLALETVHGSALTRVRD